MRKNTQWAKLCVLGLFLTAAANADHHNKDAKGLAMGGSFEGGYTQSWATGANQSQWLVDSVRMNLSAEVSDKVKVVFNNATSVALGSSTLGATFNSSRYYSGASIAMGSMMFSNLGAYLEHKCHEKVTTSFGHMATPFGMESMGDRYGMHSYYYSSAFDSARNSGTGLGWTYDLGVKFTLNDVLPGTWEMGIFDGRAGGFDTLSPALAIRGAKEFKGGSWSFAPAISSWLGRWHGGPEDIGLSAGGTFKSGMIWTNVEWVFTQRNTDPAGSQRNRIYSVYVEPGVDLGLANVSLKVDHARSRIPGQTDDTADWNLGAAVSHTYVEKYRVRLVYMHQNLSGNAGGHVNDIRLLLGTEW